MVDERQREARDPHASHDRDRRGEHLPHQLEVGRQLEQVVDCAHEDDHGGADQDRVRLLVVREEDERGRHDGHDDRQAAKARSRELVKAALARLVDRADPPGERARHGRREERDHEREPESEQAVVDAGDARSDVDEGRPRVRWCRARQHRRRRTSLGMGEWCASFRSTRGFRGGLASPSAAHAAVQDAACVGAALGYRGVPRKRSTSSSGSRRVGVPFAGRFRSSIESGSVSGRRRPSAIRASSTPPMRPPYVV